MILNYTKCLSQSQVFDQLKIFFIDVYVLATLYTRWRNCPTIRHESLLIVKTNSCNKHKLHDKLCLTLRPSNDTHIQVKKHTVHYCLFIYVFVVSKNIKLF